MRRVDRAAEFAEALAGARRESDKAFGDSHMLVEKCLIRPRHVEIQVFCSAMAGAGLAFLWFNTHPAQVFMGDVGALALGASLGTIATTIQQVAVTVAVPIADRKTPSGLIHCL